MESTNAFPEFTPTPNGVFLFRHGKGRSEAGTFSQKKLCFVATDVHLLAEVLYELSERDDCHFVKFSTHPKAGMHLGRCFLQGEHAVGTLWQHYKCHPRLMCTVQDDNFTVAFRA